MVKYYITTAIPYVNGKPHVGHALEYFQADTIRRYHQHLGQKTVLLSGADENALKNVQAAEKEGTTVKTFLDRNAKIFRDIYDFLGIKLDIFQRGSDQKKHWPGVQKLWTICDQNGDIYKKSYEGFYCVGCESFKMESELHDGLCPEHQKKPELVQEENYFFRLSNYQDKILSLIETDSLKITPENKKNEIISFIKSGLEDFSISRSKERARGVGVPVPNDESQIIYVWFDALAIYLTGIGFGWDEENWKQWWPANLHVIGKDINRFHTIYWPAMLLSAKLPLPKTVLIHSFVQSNGQKMSKTLGNVIDPYDFVNRFGLESLRYYLLSRVPLDTDGDITEEKFKEVYKSDLQNGLGNLVSRSAKLIETYKPSNYKQDAIAKFSPEVETHLIEYHFDGALKFIWDRIKRLDNLLTNKEPWKHDGLKGDVLWGELIDGIKQIAFDLQPFLPETAKIISARFSGEIKSHPPLFPKLTD